jgi:hypothetical protein
MMTLWRERLLIGSVLVIAAAYDSGPATPAGTTRPTSAAPDGRWAIDPANPVIGTTSVRRTGPAIAFRLAVRSGAQAARYSVGYRAMYLLDRSRVWMAPTPEQGIYARPIRLNVWYPAQAASGSAMSVRSYLQRSMASSYFAQLDAPLVSRDSVMILASWAGFDATRFGAVLNQPVLARRNAVPAAGRFPVVIYASSSLSLLGQDNLLLAELLASRGFVVVSTPRLGPSVGRSNPAEDVAGPEAVLRDLEFAFGAAGELPFADPARVALIGNGTGARTVLEIAARNPVPTVLLLADGPLCAGMAGKELLETSRFAVQDLRASLLAICPGITPGIGSPARILRDTLHWSEREFLDLGIDGPLQFNDAPMYDIHEPAGTPSGESKAQRYLQVRAAIVAFLTKRFAAAGAPGPTKIADPAMEGIAGAVSSRFSAALIPTEHQFVALAVAGRADTAERLYHAIRAQFPFLQIARAPILSRLARDRLSSGDGHGALAIFRLIAFVWPDRISSYDGLADSYRVLGDSVAVVASYRRLLEALPGDSTLTDADRLDYRRYAERRIREYSPR